MSQAMRNARPGSPEPASHTRYRRIALLLLVALTLGLALGTGADSGVAGAQSTSTQDDHRAAEEELAQRYAPVMFLKAQEDECDSDGEQYEPMAVDSLFDNPQIALRQVGTDDPVVMWAPGPADIAGHGKGFYLDFPGSSLSPGCVYERDFRAYTADDDAAIYAHVIVQPDRPDELVLQYWFYWYFNDWNNTHESDWEMIQIVFPASTAEEALTVEPLSVGYAQHEGGERADWDDEKLDREGSRPVVYPSAGSHASYFGSALYLGRNGSEGFGCDNTDGPSRRLDPDVILLPDEPVTDLDDPLVWTSFSGRWGERHSGPFNAPDGPYQKTRFTEPLGWHDDLRSSSVIVPTGDSQADALVRAFCGAVEWGSNQLLQFKLSPVRGLVTLVIVGSLAMFAIRRTSWQAVASLPIQRRRRFGQIVRASSHAFKRAPVVFAAIGLASVPIAIVGGVIASLFRWIPFVGNIIELFDSGNIGRLAMSLLAGGLANILTLLFVSAATAWTMNELSARRTPTVRGAFEAVASRFGVLIKGFVQAAIIVLLLMFTIVGIPFGIRQLVRYQFLPHVAMLEGRDGPQSLERSSDLVRGRWWHTALFIGIIDLILVAVLSAIGLLVLIVLRPPFWVLTIAIGLASMLVYPIATIATTLLYGDAVVEDEESSSTTDEDDVWATASTT